MGEAQESPVEAIPAATLVVFRQPSGAPAPEILMVVRSNEMSFAGGMAVFPGGRVDPHDRALAAAIADDCSDELAHRIAAIRETLEETGLAVGLTGTLDRATAGAARRRLLELGELAPVLEEFSLALDLDALVPFARWRPRWFGHSRIFDTRFYLADLGTGAVELAVDRTENTQLFWISAADALKAAENGEIGVIFPTRRNLERLAQFDSFGTARTQAEAIPVRTITPFVRGEGDARSLCIPEGLGYPVTSEDYSNVVRS